MMMNFEDHYECIVIGGGPAGATVATLLARHGHKPLLLERETFPRHHIGESLMPQTYWTFERLGMLEKLGVSDYPRKESVQFVTGSGTDSQPYFFTDRDPGAWSTTWQVRRDTFDKMMLDNAREHGVDVREGVAVRHVVMDGTRATGVEVVADGGVHEIAADVVVDASGVSALLSKALGIRVAEPDLKNASIYGYYRGTLRDEGRNSGATIIIHTPDRAAWFWYIPLPDDIASIGVVATPAYLFTGRGNDPCKTLDEEIAKTPGMVRRLESAERVGDVRVTSDFSYRAQQVAGDGWVLVGDAFGFLDPVYSSGVFLALKSGEYAADAIHEALVAGDTSGERLGTWGPRFTAGMHLMRQLVYAFYDRNFSFGKFARAHPEYQDHIVRLLIGDVFNDEVGKVFDVLAQWVKLPEPNPLERSGLR